MNEIKKLCECGCGEEVTNRFIKGHDKRKKDWKNRLVKKLCGCGCGKEVTINQNTKKHNKFINGHNKPSIGKHWSEGSKLKMSVIIKSKEVKEKARLTNLEVRGVEYPIQDLKVQKKWNQSMMKNHNVNYPLQSKDIQEKYKQTCNKNNGTNWPMQNKLVQKKYRQSMMKNHNVNYPLQSKDIQEKARLTYKEKTGFDNYSQTPEGKQNSRETMIRMIMSNYKDGSKFTPSKGFQETLILNEIESLKLFPFPILRDQKFIDYFPDGYVKELNLIIEVYESFHNGKISLERDSTRQQSLTNHLHCNFFIIYEKNWKENKEKEIQRLKNFLVLLDEGIN